MLRASLFNLTCEQTPGVRSGRVTRCAGSCCYLETLPGITAEPTPPEIVVVFVVVVLGGSVTLVLVAQLHHNTTQHKDSLCNAKATVTRLHAGHTSGEQDYGRALL